MRGKLGDSKHLPNGNPGTPLWQNTGLEDRRIYPWNPETTCEFCTEMLLLSSKKKLKK